ncbi:interferon-gamma-inducible GTPase 10-like isoform X3 [Mixophyes fleayi]|uniref:interferon-gamma-inducible GTPase 10-like isoform X3 n=1 Tax=Mixophyes fleayi TaxID=3061075 RepID=UPI003F4DD8D9
MESEKISEMISEEDMQKMKDVLKDGNITEAVSRIKEALEKADNVPVNIGITGPTGSGKSTFINVMRGIVDDEDEGAAETGCVETTREPTAYPHPQHNNVVYWDLPGIGTSNFKANDYLKKVDFQKYDFFIIIANGRFTENDILLEKAIHDLKKRCYFARSKIDSDLEASQKRRPKSYNEENILKQIREDCNKGLSGKGVLENHIFIISSFYPLKYDFHCLQETLENDLPTIKRDMFIRCLPNISVQVLEKKRKALKARIWQVSLISGGIAAVPVPGLSFAYDLTVLIGAIQVFLKDFGLTERDLQKMAIIYKKDVNDLKSVIKTPCYNTTINKAFVLKLLGSAATLLVAASLVEYSISLVPAIGSLVAGGMSFATTYWLLNKLLKDIGDDAVRVLNKVLEDYV